MDYNLIVPYIPNLRRYARALVGDRDGADDLVQDTLERAVRKFHLWRPGDLRAWLFSIMPNVFVNQRKARQFDPVMTEPIPARMYMKSPRWHDHARAAVFVLLGLAVGSALPWPHRDVMAPVAAVEPAPTLPERAARAYLVYSPEVRHPVEV